MSESTAILVAAGLSLVLGYVLGQRTEMRAAHRSALAKHLDILASSLYQILASTSIADRRVGLRQEWQDWHRRADEAAGALKRVRHEVRYPLWGLTDGLRSLSRLPHWWSNFREDRARAARLLGAAERLRRVLDLVIRRSYARGRPPTLLDRAQVWWWRSRFDKQWEVFAAQEGDDTSEGVTD